MTDIPDVERLVKDAFDALDNGERQYGESTPQFNAIYCVLRANALAQLAAVVQAQPTRTEIAPLPYGGVHEVYNDPKYGDRCGFKWNGGGGTAHECYFEPNHGPGGGAPTVHQCVCGARV